MLSTELLAVRQLVPFVGSGTETVAIIIAAVLMPLAFGYYFGGRYKAKKGRGGIITVREKLIRNILNSTVFLLMGLSYILLEIFFFYINKLGVTHRVMQTSVYSLIFLVWPIFMLGQTVPLISNFFARDKLSQITGRILFFSTVGSFMGAIMSTIVLMSLIGVNNTFIVNVVILAAVVAILSKRFICVNNILMAVFLMVTCFLNGNSMMEKMQIVENNRYSTIYIETDKDNDKTLHVNRSTSAKYSPNPDKRFPYISFWERNFINPLIKSGQKKKILVIGAGGFTLGVDDSLNDYTFVDIDSSLKKISEKYILPPGKLGENKKFDAQDARAFLSSAKEKYDLIFLDAFSNIYNVPSYLLTVEFFQQVNSHLADGGVLLFNCITSPNFKSRYSVKVDNTMKQVFPNISRQIIGDFDGWSAEAKDINIIYIYFKNNTSSAIYTDDKNTYFLDH